MGTQKRKFDFSNLYSKNENVDFENFLIKILYFNSILVLELLSVLERNFEL